MDATSLPPEHPPRPRSHWISLILLSALILVYVVIVNRPSSQPGGTSGPAIGRRLDLVELQGLTGGAGDVTLDDLQGKVTLVNFWGTWCPPCLREFPHLVKLMEPLQKRSGFQAYLVSCGEKDDPELGDLRLHTEQFLASTGASLPIWADQNAATRKAMILRLGLEDMSYPTTLILDRTGTIRGFWQGYHRGAPGEMRELIEELLMDEASNR